MPNRKPPAPRPLSEVLTDDALYPSSETIAKLAADRIAACLPLGTANVLRNMRVRVDRSMGEDETVLTFTRDGQILDTVRIDTNVGLTIEQAKVVAAKLSGEYDDRALAREVARMIGEKP